MSTASAGLRGQPPRVLIKPIPPNPEREKYRKLWQNPDYRIVSPGEQVAQLFLHRARPPSNAEIIDFGAGTGRGALMLALFGKLKVKMLDFAENCLDEEVAQACETQKERISFRVHDLTKPIREVAPYGYCCDVMEHIPTVDVPKVLRNILASAQHVFFCISIVDDLMGASIGETLHLTVKPMEWWEQAIKEVGAVIHWSQLLDDETGVPSACAIYCSSWHKDAAELVKTGALNVSDEVLEAQIRQNIEAGYLQVTPHTEQDRELILLAGGPSMKGQLEKIRDLRSQGCALVTVNGAYRWAIENSLDPSCQIVLDAREFNSRFVQPPHPTCRYLIASQCHPATLAGVPKERTMLWHAGISDKNQALMKALGLPYYPIVGGTTVVLRAFALMRMLGYSSFHVFGFDSCVMEDGTHHAYAQPENDDEPVVPVTCGARLFRCTPWQLTQASNYRELVAILGDAIQMHVYGDGLISHMITTGAEFAAAAAAEQPSS